MENVPALPSNFKTMSSRVIAEITKKEHSHVLRDIRVMLQELYPNMDGLESKGIIFRVREDNGQTKEVELPKRETLILTAGYSISQRASIIDRWQELEEKVTTANPQISAMIFALQSLDAVQQQQKAHAEELALHVAALDSHSERIASIEAKSSAIISQHEFYSVLGYSKLHGIKIDVKKASHYGKLATAESKRHGVMTGTVPDPRFGTVKTYHTEILDIVFGK